MKIIIKSTHPERGLLNADQNWLPGHRPAVAKVTPLLENRLAKGDFRLLVGNLADAATDLEFATFLHEAGDTDLAISAFEAKYSIETYRQASGSEEEAEAAALALSLEASKKADEAKKLSEEIAKKLAEEEAAKKPAEEEAAKKLADEEAAKKADEARKLADEEAAKKLADEEAAKKPEAKGKKA